KEFCTSVTSPGAGSGAVMTGGGDTVTLAVPRMVSLVAVMVVVPAATPVTRPAPETVARAELPVLHETTRPVRTLPLASRVTAESCAVAPTMTLDVAGETVTDATGTGAGAVTVMDAVPVRPSLEAVIVAVPAATPVTSPELETAAMLAFALDQVTTRPLNTLPFASRVTAVSCALAPINMLEPDGETETVATGIGAGVVTASEAEPLWPSLVALMMEDPAATAETSPFAETLATLGLEVCQVTTRPESELPVGSRRVAVARPVCPTTSDDGLSVTNTVATGIGGGVRTVSE